ncbi:MAG: NADH-quinone oxidoreductase subunit J [Desulfurococcales archaeon]|nr:NADH-quinone oxidoreductase subunit J [Desulfurococcales archaeon]
MIEAYTPLLAGIIAVSMVLAAYMVVRARDLVYASGSLAILGLLNALMLALLGYSIVAAFLVVVYVGAAVMFIIITVSMLGGGRGEKRDEEKGLFVATTIATALALIAYTAGYYKAFTRPETIPISTVSEFLASNYGVALAIVFIALAATLVEAISIARRG